MKNGQIEETMIYIFDLFVFGSGWGRCGYTMAGTNYYIMRAFAFMAQRRREC
jgi:hypothetical protein